MQTRPRLTPAVANARRAVRECLEHPELDGLKHALLAVSGGPDSMALAIAAQFELKKKGIRVSAAVVNHNLQPGSLDVANEALQKLEGLGISAKVIEIQVPNGTSGPEAEARTARYEALEAHRREIAADVIFTGHNQNDQAETVLLGLTRGSGLRSLAGMKVVDQQLVRPFLAIPKAELEAVCLDSGVTFWQDPHNQDDAFTRVRIRKLMEKIDAELGPGIVGALSRTAEMASEVDEFLTLEANKLIALAKDGEGYRVQTLLGAHPALRNKALQLLALGHGGKSISRVQVLAVAELITNWHGQKPLSLSGITVERVREQILFRQSS